LELLNFQVVQSYLKNINFNQSNTYNKYKKKNMEELFKENYLLEINYLRLFVGILIFILLIYIVSKNYIKHGNSRDDKSRFVRNLYPFGVSMLLIVLVIKSSLALSLGLVGALSIIRFRTAIKETEQIILLLMVMALAISVASEKELLAIIFTIVYVIVFSKNKKPLDSKYNKILQISFKNNSEINLDKIYLNSLENNVLRISKTIENKYNVEYEILKEGEEINILNYFKNELNLKIDFVLI
jgi:hypothetical protein